MFSIRYLFRRILRSPGFVAIVIATIALAIGVNLGIFSVTQSVLLKSLGVPDANKLFQYTLGSGNESAFLSGPAYQSLRENGAVKELLAWKLDQFHVQSPDGATLVMGALATGNTFDVLRLKPFLGRFFNEAEDVSGGGDTGWAAVLSYDYWKTHYAADPNVIGKEVTIDGAPVHIVGVLPREFGGLMPPISTQILLPRHFQAISSPGVDRFASPNYQEWLVFGRLPPRLSVQSIHSNLQTIESAVREAADPKHEVFTSDDDSQLSVKSGATGTANAIRLFRIPLLAMEVLAGILLLLCSGNLILLFAGRASREAHATWIRAALGARPKHSLHFAVLEASTLAVMGSLAAALIAWGTAHILVVVIQSIPGLNSFPTVAPSLPLLLIATAVVLAIAVLSAACATLWYGRKQPLSVPVTGGNRVATRSNIWIVGVEVFAAILLITGSSMGWIGFQKLLHEDSGFAADTVVTATLDLNQAQADTKVRNEKMRRIIEQIQGAPGVQSVAMINISPLSGGTSSNHFAVRQDNGSMQEQRGIWEANVSPNYFFASGTQVLRGRSFDAGDLAGDSVCLLSMNAASTFFGAEDPLGKYLYPYTLNSQIATPSPYCRVIGIAKDAHLQSMSEAPNRVVYLLTPKIQPSIIVRASNSALAVQAIRSAVQAIAPGSLASGVDPIRTLIKDDLRLNRVLSVFAAVCAVITVMILGIGVFGVLALEVSQRTREIGIRIALGATRTAVCISTFKKLRLAISSGIILGSVLAILVARMLAHLYNLNMTFAIGIYFGSVLLLCLLMVVAAIVPLSRALAVSPMECLAAE